TLSALVVMPSRRAVSPGPNHCSFSLLIADLPFRTPASVRPAPGSDARARRPVCSRRPLTTRPSLSERPFGRSLSGRRQASYLSNHHSRGLLTALAEPCRKAKKYASVASQKRQVIDEQHI